MFILEKKKRERENRGKCISEKRHPFSKYRVIVLQLHERPESTVALWVFLEMCKLFEKDKLNIDFYDEYHQPLHILLCKYFFKILFVFYEKLFSKGSAKTSLLQNWYFVLTFVIRCQRKRQTFEQINERTWLLFDNSHTLFSNHYKKKL